MKILSLNFSRYFLVIMLFSGFVVHTSYGQAPQYQAICKEKNFSTFFSKFTESIEMQKQCTMFPIDKLELVESEEDLVPKNILLSREQIVLPLILNNQARQEQKLKLHIDTINNKKANVIIYKPDTGYKIIYRFVKKNNWQLIKIEDWSV